MPLIIPVPLDLLGLQARLRDQLDHEAPAPALPDHPGFDLYDTEDAEAVRLLRLVQSRDAAAALILVGAVQALQLVGYGDDVVTLTYMLAIGRADWWITEADLDPVPVVVEATPGAPGHRIPPPPPDLADGMGDGDVGQPPRLGINPDEACEGR